MLLYWFVLDVCNSGSAGVGRTGTLIVIDTQLQRIEKHGTVDIFNNTTLLRQNRNIMVQQEVGETENISSKFSSKSGDCFRELHLKCIACAHYCNLSSNHACFVLVAFGF